MNSPRRTIMLSAKRTYFIFVLLMGVLVMAVLPTRLHAQLEPTPTPTPFVVRSIFANDTCAPPCWFGLTPGVSTYQEVSAFFENPIDEPSVSFGLWVMYGTVDGQRRITNGNYRFSFRTPIGRPNNVDAPNGILTVRNRILYSIDVWMFPVVPLERVLAALGNPGEVRFERGEPYRPNLHFVYPEFNMRVILTSEWEECDLTEIENVFLVDVVIYYSPEAALDIAIPSPIKRRNGQDGERECR